MSTTISNLHSSSDEGNWFAFVRGEREQTCIDAIMTQSEHSPDMYVCVCERESVFMCVYVHVHGDVLGLYLQNCANAQA